MAKLTPYYDALVKEEAASKLWLSFTKRHVSGKRILELAAGTGEITRLLALSNYSVMATDIDSEMLAVNMNKNSDLGIQFEYADMRDFSLNQKFEGIVCYCDSVNYLESIHEVQSFFQHVDAHLENHGVFLFDIHAKERLEEFQEPFIEEGYIDDVAYQWSIETSENRLYHHFCFWENENTSEYSFYQTVFDVEEIISSLIELGFSCDIWTDFIYGGVVSGERYCIVAKKGVL